MLHCVYATSYRKTEKYCFFESDSIKLKLISQYAFLQLAKC